MFTIELIIIYLTIILFTNGQRQRSQSQDQSFFNKKRSTDKDAIEELVTSTFLKPMQINIYEGKYIYLIIGNPGKYVKMKLNFSIDKTILYGDIEQTSQTYSFYDNERKIGSEIFYLNQYRIRLPVVKSIDRALYQTLDDFYYLNRNNSLRHNSYYQTPDMPIKTDVSTLVTEQSPADNNTNKKDIENFYKKRDLIVQSSEQYNNQLFKETLPEDLYGEFALGPGSRLWKYWHNYTITIDSIFFGSYDRFSEMHNKKQQAKLRILAYNPLWSHSSYSLTTDIESLHELSVKNHLIHNINLKKKINDKFALDKYKDEKNEYFAFDKINPIKLNRGSFVVEGYVGENKYFVVVDYESAITMLPKNLKRKNKFTIEFYENIEQQKNTLQENKQSLIERPKNSPLSKQYLIERLNASRFTKNQNFGGKCNPENDKCIMSTFNFDHKYHSTIIKSERRYKIIYESDRSDLIVLGKYSARHFSIFINRMEKSVILSQSYHYFTDTITSYYIITCFISFVVSWWLLSLNFKSMRKDSFQKTNPYKFKTNVKHSLTENEISIEQTRHQQSIFLNIFIILQILVSIYVLVTCVILIYGYDVDKYIKHYFRSQHYKFILYTIIIVCVTMAFYNLVDNIVFFRKYIRLEKKRIYNEYRSYQKFEKLITDWEKKQRFKTLFIESCSFMTIWLCLAKHHQTTIDLFYLAYIGIIIAVTTTFQALKAHFINSKDKWLFYVQGVAIYLFLHFYNIVPLIDSLWNLKPLLKHQISFIFEFAVVFGTCLHLYTTYLTKY